MTTAIKTSPRQLWPSILVGVGVVGIALAMFAGLAVVVISHQSTSGSDLTGESTSQFVWHFARTLGFLRPLLLILGALYLLRLGWGLISGRISSARWARSIFIWIMIVATTGLGLVVLNSVAAEAADNTPAGATLVADALPWLVGLLYIVTLYLILNRNMHHFHGDEHIASQRARNAWNMLAPILIIFLIIGLRPLEQVFITSLTNEDFAIGIESEVDLIGLDNFRNLLGIRLDEIPCEQGDAGSCLTETDAHGNQQPVYPRARRYLNDNVPNYRTISPNLASYVPFTEFDLFGKHFALSVRDPVFIDSVVNSMVYSIVAIFFQLVIGLFMAMVLTSKLRGMGLMRVALLVPLAIPTLIATQFWDVMLRPDASGLVNNALLEVGFINEPKRWLLDSGLQIPSLILVIVWKETPSMALLLLPGLISISPEIYQAASVDGANRIQQFFRLTLPMLRPAIGVALILRTMVMLRVFDVFEVLLGRRQFSMASYAYDRLTQEQLLGYSSAISVVIFVIILAFTLIYMRTLKIDEI